MTAFLKMHGLGNDFVVFDGRKSGIPLEPALARAVADRRLGRVKGQWWTVLGTDPDLFRYHRKEIAKWVPSSAPK